jgi:hypothetical protein
MKRSQANSLLTAEAAGRDVTSWLLPVWMEFLVILLILKSSLVDKCGESMHGGKILTLYALQGMSE